MNENWKTSCEQWVSEKDPSPSTMCFSFFGEILLIESAYHMIVTEYMISPFFASQIYCLKHRPIRIKSACMLKHNCADHADNMFILDVLKKTVILQTTSGCTYNIITSKKVFVCRISTLYVGLKDITRTERYWISNRFFSLWDYFQVYF